MDEEKIRRDESVGKERERMGCDDAKGILSKGVDLKRR